MPSATADRPERVYSASVGMTRGLAEQARAKVASLGFGASYLRPIGDDLYTVVIRSNRTIATPSAQRIAQRVA